MTRKWFESRTANVAEIQKFLKTLLVDKCFSENEDAPKMKM